MTAPAQNTDSPARSLRLLRTKLFIPRPHPDVVPRPRLIQKLDESLRRKLTIVSAPAGSGKSTLLSSWVEGYGLDPAGPAAHATGQPLQCAWLSLDERDNDPSRFWAYFVASLQTLRPEIGATALSMLQSVLPPPVENLLTELLNDITALTGDAVLILDDYHSLTAPAIHEGLAFLLDNLPRQMHLVISGRTEPPLPLPQYRVRRELVELRAEDLRFSREEAAAFLKQVMGINLTADDLEALDRLTEGWVAGLQLAALSMQGNQDFSTFFQSFGGSHRFVFDYLAQEVLYRQPEPVRDFLMRTSILERLCAEVCEALLAGEGEAARPGAGQEMLAYLERANLFLAPLDSQRRWYRYHHLFSEFLRARLEAEIAAQQVADLHRRAGGWFERQGLVSEAVSHAIQSGDYELAARIIQAGAEGMFLRSELTTLVRWLKLLPAAVVSADPKLSMIFAWSLLATAETETVEDHLLDVERQLGAVADGSAESLTLPVNVRGALAEVASIRASLAFNRMDLDRVVELSQMARRYLDAPAAEGLYNPGRALRAVTWFNLAVASEFRGQTPAAIEAFTETIACSYDNPHLMPMALGHLAQLQITQGRLRQAEETYQQAQDWLQKTGWVSPLSAMIYTGIGNILCERDELEPARQSLERGIEMGRPWNNWESLLSGYFGLARLLAAQKNLPAARAALAELADLARKFNQTITLPAIQVQQALLAARQGDLEEADRWVQSLTLPSEGAIPFWLENDATILARILICQGKYSQAADLAGRLLQAFENDQRRGRSIEALVIQATARSLSGAVEGALSALRRALSLAEPEGYMRIFLDEGEPIRQLLMAVAKLPMDPPLKGYLGRLSKAIGIPPAGTPSLPAPPVKAGPPIEPLSERELEVLRLMAQGLTNQEIAERLVISLNTVKSHVKNILAHLEVGNRTQATARARQLGLL